MIFYLACKNTWARDLFHFSMTNTEISKILYLWKIQQNVEKKNNLYLHLLYLILQLAKLLELLDSNLINKQSYSVSKPKYNFLFSSAIFDFAYFFSHKRKDGAELKSINIDPYLKLSSSTNQLMSLRLKLWINQKNHINIRLEW